MLPNPNGTAPGLAIKVENGRWKIENGGMQRSQSSILDPPSSQWLIMLPGPPRELHPMFKDAVVPLLQRELPPQIFVCRTIRTAGIGESALAEQIEAPLQPLVAAGLELGYCARPGQVDVRLAARTSNAENLVADAQQIVERLLVKNIFAHDDEDIEAVIVRELTARKQTLAIAESCTGGGIAHRITNVPGASAVLLAGLVTYANEAKIKFVGVRPETLAAHGAVSEPVVREMAERTGIDAYIRQQNAIIARPDYRPMLTLIDCPTLVLCGRQDRLTPLEESEAMAKAIAKSKLVMVEECGHMSTLERPEEVNRAMRAWLRRES